MSVIGHEKRAYDVGKRGTPTSQSPIVPTFQYLVQIPVDIKIKCFLCGKRFKYYSEIYVYNGECVHQQCLAYFLSGIKPAERDDEQEEEIERVE
jgi:hypothetical protein